MAEQHEDDLTVVYLWARKEAEDEIKALRVEIERLRESIEEIADLKEEIERLRAVAIENRAEADAAHGYSVEMRHENDLLREENERLRKVLRAAEQGLAAALSWSCGDKTWWVANEDVIKVRDAIRAALGEKK